MVMDEVAGRTLTTRQKCEVKMVAMEWNGIIRSGIIGGTRRGRGAGVATQ